MPLPCLLPSFTPSLFPLPYLLFPSLPPSFPPSLPFPPPSFTLFPLPPALIPSHPHSLRGRPPRWCCCGGCLGAWPACAHTRGADGQAGQQDWAWWVRVQPCTGYGPSRHAALGRHDDGRGGGGVRVLNSKNPAPVPACLPACWSVCCACRRVPVTVCMPDEHGKRCT